MVSTVAFRAEDKFLVTAAKAKDTKGAGARAARGRPTSPAGFSKYIPKEKYDDDSCK